MKILKVFGIILLVIAVFFGAVAIWVSTISPSGSFERSITINKPASIIYPEVINMKKYDSWNHWYHIDPAAYTYEGPEEGIGAKSIWDSENSDLGSGWNEIIANETNKMVKTKLSFGGLAGDFYGTITLKEAEGATTVLWYYNYENMGFVGKLLTGMGDISEVLGPPFENSLKMLKEKVEAFPDPKPVQLPEVVEVDLDTVTSE